jgi:hypothetical protein
MGIKIPNIKFTQRESTVANILKGMKGIKSFLNVGFRNWDDERTHWWIEICDYNKINWNILEVFNLNILRALDEGCPKDKIYLGNMLDTSSYDNYDVIMFWHGPEHINKEAFLSSLKSIEDKANKLVIFGMPLGEEKQGQIYGNPNEEHVSSWDPSEFEKIGYTTEIVRDRTPAHFTAWRIFGL